MLSDQACVWLHVSLFASLQWASSLTTGVRLQRSAAMRLAGSVTETDVQYEQALRRSTLIKASAAAALQPLVCCENRKAENWISAGTIDGGCVGS